MHRRILRAPNGLPMVVIRPSDPAIPVRLATALVGLKDDAAFQSIPEKAAAEGVTYTLAGFWGLRKKRHGVLGPRCILDREGGYLGEIQPGDSVVTLNADSN